MTGTKRSWEGDPLVDKTKPTNTAKNNNADANAAMDEPSSKVLSIFGTFRDELDEHHDRRERIIKTSRDITALSKKIIFSLQRTRTIKSSLPPTIAKETTTRFDQIHSLFTSLAPDLTAVNTWRYQRNISPGIQEFIEALSFHHYILTQELITKEEVQAKLPREVLVTEEDYLMGLFDLTGEIMRFAVTGLSSGAATSAKSQEKQEGNKGEVGEGDGGAEGELRMLPEFQAGLVVDLRAMRALFEMLSVPRRHHMLRDFGKKMDVMQSSVEKVEKAAYGILVRGSERPAGWMPDLSHAVDVESY